MSQPRNLTRPLTSYTHQKDQEYQQLPLVQQGRKFYVSVINGDRWCLALGPFADHGDAIAWKERVRDHMVEQDSYAHFYSYGTCSLPAGDTRTGKLNDILGYTPSL